MKEFDATFDSENDQPKKPVPGKYPSHVSGFEAVTLKSGGKVFNIDFTLAEECKSITKEKTMICLWTRQWICQWKNKKYNEFFTNMGVKFPVNGDGIVQLQEVEEEDIIGLPAIVDVQVYKYTTKQGEERTSLRIMNTYPWNDGVKKDNVPF